MTGRRRRVLPMLVFAAAVAAAGSVVLHHVVRSTRAGTSTRASATPGPRRRPRATHLVTSATPGPAALRRRRVTSVPILMYHVINPAPANARFPGLYVDPAAFAAQMQALAAAGYRAVTLDQVAANWAGTSSLPRGRPIVISFDNGYRSQYTNAFPVLRRVHWRAVENLQLTGLPPSQGGLDAREIRRLVDAGWELDTQGFAHLDLTTLSTRQLRHEVLDARVAMRRRYHVAVRWFCYPSGRYDPVVEAAVKSAGYAGATTVAPGWANASADPYRLPRLRVFAGTAPAALLALIAGTRSDPAPPGTYAPL